MTKHERVIKPLCRPSFAGTLTHNMSPQIPQDLPLFLGAETSKLRLHELLELKAQALVKCQTAMLVDPRDGFPQPVCGPNCFDKARSEIWLLALIVSLSWSRKQIRQDHDSSCISMALILLDFA